VEAVRPRIQAEFGDICTLDVDAIVNPAHPDLLGGGGLDGFIHEAAGPELIAACSLLGGCETGNARVTPGFRLPARWVIHTVGPIWKGGNAGEEDLLASCYRRCLEEAATAGVRSIAIPGISTGLHGFPVARAAPIAVREVASFLRSSAWPERVLFVCFDHSSLEMYSRLLNELDSH
jgi:O-acetyl-ADP-ribose deacetylase (regulator of RNase III)